MRFLVVLFALVAVAVAAPAPTSSENAASGTAKKRSIGHVTYTVPATVSHYSGVNLQSPPTLVAAAPVNYAVVSEPVAARTVSVGPAVYGVRQSSVNLHHSPAVVTSYSSPVLSQQVSSPTVVDARSVYSPVAAVYSAPSAVSHQSRVDIHSSPAVYETRSVYSPSVYSPSVYSPSVYSPSVYSPSVYSPSVSYW